MKTKRIANLLTAGFACVVATITAEASAPPVAPDTAIDRRVLPIPEPERPTSTRLDVRDATPPPRF